MSFIEVTRLPSGWSVTTEWIDVRPIVVTLDRRVRNLALRTPDDQLSWRGPPPPLSSTAIDYGEDYRGLDLDIVWAVKGGALGPFVWAQAFRRGRETTAPVEGPPELQFRIELGYADLLRIVYMREPFESVLGVDETAAAFSTLSCVSGLLHGEDTSRTDAFLPRERAALLEWAQTTTMQSHAEGAVSR